MKLGKLAPRFDKRTLKLADYTASVPPPASCDYSGKVPSWPMMANDRLGDCTCAAAGHLVELWTCDASTEAVVTDAQIIAAYSAVSGYNPVTGANDNGAVELDVLKYWRKTGIGGHKISAFTSLNVGNKDEARAAVYLFGGCYIGLALPISAQSQDVWDVPKGGAKGKGAPGSWGGHAVPVVAYDADGLTVVTWGALKRMTWKFWNAYCEEAYAVLSPDWFTSQKISVSGFNVAALQSDLKKFMAKKSTAKTEAPKTAAAECKHCKGTGTPHAGTGVPCEHCGGSGVAKPAAK